MASYFVKDYSSIPLEVESVTEMRDALTQNTAFRIRFKALSTAQLNILQDLGVRKYPAYVDYASDGTRAATYDSVPTPK